MDLVVYLCNKQSCTFGVGEIPEHRGREKSPKEVFRSEIDARAHLQRQRENLPRVALPHTKNGDMALYPRSCAMVGRILGENGGHHKEVSESHASQMSSLL